MIHARLLSSLLNAIPSLLQQPHNQCSTAQASILMLFYLSLRFTDTCSAAMLTRLGRFPIELFSQVGLARESDACTHGCVRVCSCAYVSASSSVMAACGKFQEQVRNHWPFIVLQCRKHLFNHVKIWFLTVSFYLKNWPLCEASLARVQLGMDLGLCVV